MGHNFMHFAFNPVFFLRKIGDFGLHPYTQSHLIVRSSKSQCFFFTGLSYPFLFHGMTTWGVGFTAFNLIDSFLLQQKTLQVHH